MNGFIFVVKEPNIMGEVSGNDYSIVGLRPMVRL